MSQPKLGDLAHARQRAAHVLRDASLARGRQSRLAEQIGEDPIRVPLAVDEDAIVVEDDEVEGQLRAREHPGSLARNA